MIKTTWLITFYFDSGKVRYFTKTKQGHTPPMLPARRDVEFWVMDCGTAVCLTKIESFKIERKES